VGAGRTEMMRAIFGLDAIKSGEVKIASLRSSNKGNSQAGKRATPSRRWAQGLGMVSEDRKMEGLALNLSIADNITLPKLGGLGPGRFVLPSSQRNTSQQWIKKVEVKCTGPGQRVDALSGGNQQKIAIARLLHADVDILLLDEPTRGIDVGSKAQIYKLIDELASGDPKQGLKPKAILLISSYLPELLGVCDEIAVMDRGKLSPSRPVGQWDEHSLMMVATGQDGE